ncbi:hypothetical protein pb186bvf_004234 [Paramecium bursaria]
MQIISTKNGTKSQVKILGFGAHQFSCGYGLGIFAYQHFARLNYLEPVVRVGIKGSGFIAIHIATQLVKNGYRVVVDDGQYTEKQKQYLVPLLITKQLDPVKDLFVYAYKTTLSYYKYCVEKHIYFGLSKAEFKVQGDDRGIIQISKKDGIIQTILAEEDFLMELKNEALGLGVQFGSYEVDHEIIVDEDVDQQFIKYIKEIETGLLDFNAYPKL